MLQLVLDTNVLVAGLRSRRGASFELIQLIPENRFRLNVSVALALEYEDVLKRPEVVPGISERDADMFLDLYSRHRPCCNSFRDYGRVCAIPMMSVF